MILFKDDRLKKEFHCDLLDTSLRAMAFMLSGLADHYFERDLLVSRIFATTSENKAIGGRPDSAHLFWRAIDFSSQNWTETKAKFLMSIMLSHLVRLDGKWILNFHKVAGGHYHFHLQTPELPNIISFNIVKTSTPL
jgi:hypothetical protein